MGLDFDDFVGSGGDFFVSGDPIGYAFGTGDEEDRKDAFILLSGDPMTQAYHINSYIKEQVQTSADPLDDVLEDLMNIYTGYAQTMYDTPTAISQSEDVAFEEARQSQLLSGSKTNRQTRIFGGA